MLERPGCTSASRSWPVPSSYMVLSTRLLRLALGSSPRRAQRGLLAPAPASLLLQNSRFDLGEEQPQLPPLGLMSCTPGKAPPPWLAASPAAPRLLSPLQPRGPQPLGAASHGSDSSAPPVPGYKSLRVCAQGCSEQVLNPGWLCLSNLPGEEQPGGALNICLSSHLLMEN